MNKGFRALPEYVQRKIDPEMAKKFNDGGIVSQLGPQVNVTMQKDILGRLNNRPTGVNSNASPVFQRFGNDLSNSLTQKVPNFVQKVQGQAEQEFGKDTFQNSGGISAMPQYRNEFTSGLGQRIGGLSQINNLNNVLNRNMFQSQPVQMAMGGEAMMGMPEQPPTAPPDQVQFMEDMSRQQGAQLADQMMTDIDAADDPKSMIDALRGNEKPLEARYAELAGYVGEADAQQTPESVLAMVQPTIMMTEEGAIDSGIGELMQGVAGQIDMETPSGEATSMGQGVGELMAMGAGNTPPVNFNQGGAVRHYAPGGAVTERATTMLPEFQSLYASVLGDPAQRQAELDEQKKLTKAQMLFDIAQTALAAGAPTAQPMSFAERLMSAAQGTQLFNKIGDRAAGQLQAKQALEAEKRQMDLAALQSSISQASTDKAAADALELAAAKKTGIDTDYKRVVTTDGTDLGTFDVNVPERKKAFEAALMDNPGSTAYNLGTQPKTDKIDFKTVTLYPVDGDGEPITMPLTNKEEFAAIIKKTSEGNFTEDATAYNTRIADDAKIKAEKRETETKTLYSLTDSSELPRSFNVKDPDQKKEYDELLASQDWTADSKAYDIALTEKVEQNQYDRDRKDFLSDIDAQVARDIAEEERKLGRALDKESRDRVEFNRRLAAETNLRIETEQRARKEELSREERANIEYRARLAVQEQMDIDKELRVLEQKGNYKIIEKDGQVFAIDNATLEQTLLFGTKDVPEPIYKEITLPSADGSLVTTVVDITSPQGKQAIALVNQVSLDGGQASMRNIPTANIIPRGFFIPDEGIFTSYDGGKTYVDNDGVTQNVPGGAYEVSNQIAYDVAKKEKVKANALQQLQEMDAVLASGVTDEKGNLLSAKDRLEVIDAYTEARKGTGFWSKIAAAVDAIAGGVFAPEYFAETFKDTQEARKFVKMIRVLGRSALAVSPRFAVADLEQVAQLFPNEEALFTNPVTEAKKLQTIAGYLDQQKVVILENLAGDVPLDKTLQSQLQQKLFEINRLQEILGPINSIGASQSSTEAFNEAVGLINQGVKPGVKND